MPDTIPDLWPDDVMVSVITPLAILRYQAAQLKSRTKHLLEAEVTTEFGERQIVHHFDLLAPALDHYRYRLFSVRHDRSLVYPVTVFGQGLSNVLHVHTDELFGDQWPEAATQQELVEIIGKILRSGLARSVIQSLIAQSNERKTPA